MCEECRWEVLQALRRERRVGGQRRWGQACTLEERWDPSEQGVIKCTVQAGRSTFLGISVKFKSRQGKSNPRMWGPDIEKRTTWQASPTWSERAQAFKPCISPGRHLQCQRKPVTADLLSCFFITSLQSLSERSLPTPSFPSRLQGRVPRSQQHWAVFHLQSYPPAWIANALTFPSSWVLPSPFYHRDKQRKIYKLSFSDDKKSCCSAFILNFGKYRQL